MFSAKGGLHMTYHELVLKVRNIYEYADAREVYEHVAVQVNITGEAEGIFYIEIAERQICVEPYDYYDRDILVTVDSTTLNDICDGKLNYAEAYKKCNFKIEGNPHKIELLSKVKFKR